MKRVILVFLVFVVSVVLLHAELLFEENFDYDAGTDLTDNGWIVAGQSGGIPVVSPGLTYSGNPTYPSQIGNAISIGTTAEDDYKTFTEVTSGTVYMSFLFKASDAPTSDADFIAVGANPNNSGFYGRVLAKKIDSNLEFSISQGPTNTGYTNNDYNFNETYLIVMKYLFVDGESNDEVSLYVFPASISHASEPETATIEPITAASEASEIGGILIKQGAPCPTAYIDGIRIGTTWSDTALPVTLSSFTASYSKNSAILNWTTQSETDNLGFNLYRSENQNGFDNSRLLNSTLIPGMGTTSTPTSYSFADEYPVIEGHIYYYWLESVSTSNELELFGPVDLEIPVIGHLPTMTILEANYPNPFNPETTISFNIKENETGTLSIFNLKGEKILKEEFEAGDHQYNWNAEGLSSGIFFYKLSSPTTNLTKKMILMK